VEGQFSGEEVEVVVVVVVVVRVAAQRGLQGGESIRCSGGLCGGSVAVWSE
jgi:hypothetical protein